MMWGLLNPVVTAPGIAYQAGTLFDDARDSESMVSVQQAGGALVPADDNPSIAAALTAARDAVLRGDAIGAALRAIGVTAGASQQPPAVAAIGTFAAGAFTGFATNCAVSIEPGAGAADVIRVTYTNPVFSFLVLHEFVRTDAPGAFSVQVIRTKSAAMFELQFHDAAGAPIDLGALTASFFIFAPS